MLRAGFAELPDRLSFDARGWVPFVPQAHPPERGFSLSAVSKLCRTGSRQPGAAPRSHHASWTFEIQAARSRCGNSDGRRKRSCLIGDGCVSGTNAAMVSLPTGVNHVQSSLPITRRLACIWLRCARCARACTGSRRRTRARRLDCIV